MMTNDQSFRDAIAVALAMADDEPRRGNDVIRPYGLDERQRELVIALATLIVQARDDPGEWLESLARGGAGR